MIGVILILLFAGFMAFFFPYEKKEAKKPELKSPKYDAQMKKLWTIAQSSMKEREPLRAEKALLTILRFDETNASAYNRLGILYAKEQKFDEAIECFEIAQSLDNNASSLHNAGLIYLETGAFEKAAMAFEQALEMEGDLPARHIALAKAKEKLGKRREAIESLENAYELDRSVTTLRQMLSLHEAAEDQEAIAETTLRIKEHLEEAAGQKRTTTKRRAILRKPTARKVASSSTTKTKTATRKSPATTIRKTKVTRQAPAKTRTRAVGTTVRSTTPRKTTVKRTRTTRKVGQL